MRIIFGLLLALSMVLAAVFAIVDMTGEQPRAPEDREVVTEMREDGIYIIDDLVFRSLEAAEIRGATVIRSNNTTLHSRTQETVHQDAWCQEVTYPLKTEIKTNGAIELPSLDVQTAVAKHALPGRKRGRTGI